MKKAVIYVRVRVTEGSQEVIDRQLEVMRLSVSISTMRNLESP